MTRLRVLAALIMAPLAIAAVLLLSTPWMVAVAAVVLLAGLWEWLRLIGIDDALGRGVLLLANLLLMVALVWGSTTDPTGSLVLFKLISALGVVWWLAVLLWLRHPGFAARADGRSRIIKLVAATFTLLPAWCALAIIHAGQPHGHRWLLLALLIVWTADSGAYFAGRRFGRRKLSPAISPNKTIEGLVGGALTAIVVALALAPLAGAGLSQLPGVAVVAALTVGFSVIGDLLESLLKRHAGVKDSGNTIPGHGGVLDRIDSILAALPVFAVGQLWFGF